MSLTRSPSGLARLLPALLLAGCLGLASSACATTSVLRAADPVGPDPRSTAAAEEEGTLAVYTELAPNPDNPGENQDYVRKPFTVLDPSRRVLVTANHGQYHDPNVHPLKLRPGSYLVRGPGLAGRTFQQEVEVVVRVDAGKTTEVHFDQPWQVPEGLAGNGLSAKALPDWRLGWGARSGSKLGTEGELRYVGSPVAGRLVSQARSASLAVGSNDADGVAAVQLGTADLAGVAGEVKAPDGISCKVVGLDQIAFLVRADSPLRSLDAAQVRALLSGEARSWSSLGQGPAPLLLLVGRGTGAELRVSSPRAVAVDPSELLQRVALAGDVLAVSSLSSAHGDARVRALAAPDDGAASSVTLSVCGAASNAKAMAVVAWAASPEGQELGASTLSLRKASGPAASR